MDARYMHLPATMVQLQDVFTVELVDRPTEPFPQRNEIIAVDCGVSCDAPTLHQHRSIRGNDGADFASGELALPVNASLGERSVFVVKSTGYTRAEDAVLDCQIPELKGREDDIVYHGPDPPVRVWCAWHTKPGGAKLVG